MLYIVYKKILQTMLEFIYQSSKFTESIERGCIMKNKILKVALFTSLAAAMMISTLSGCASTTVTKSEPKSSVSSEAKDEMVELTTVRGVNPSVVLAKGETWDNNAVYKAYETDHKIKIKNIWAVDTQQYAQKLALMITTGDLPDFFQITTTKELAQLAEADLIMDLTKLYDEKASSIVKARQMYDGGTQLNYAKIGGKLMALPYCGPINTNLQLMWIRTDWLKNLKLEMPKTMDEVLAVAKAFSTKDPDGNKKDDTTGISVGKALNGWALALQPAFNGYHSYPGIWVEKSGKLEYGSIQPEMKTALAAMQKAYKEGLIDPEFTMKDPDKATEYMINNRAGITFGVWWADLYLEKGVAKNGKQVQEWEPMLVPSIDSNPTLMQTGIGVPYMFVVNKNCKNPEKVIEMLNIFSEVDNGSQIGEIPSGKEVYFYGASKEFNDPKWTNNNNWALNPVVSGSQNNEMSEVTFPAAIKAKDSSKIKGAWATGMYKNAMTYINDKNLVQWVSYKHAQALEKSHELGVNKQIQFDQFYGTPGEEMTAKFGTLQAKEEETFINIIIGNEKIESFDTFVADWKKLGGDAITAEVNAWKDSIK